MDSANTETTNKEATIADIGTFKLQRFTNEAPQKAQYLPSVHGKATDAIAQMAGKKIEKDLIAQSGSIKAGEVKLIVREIDKLSGKLGVSTHKLLSMGIACFTDQNHTGLGNNKGLRALRVSFPLQEYALACGYDVIEHPVATQEEAKKEAQRVENAIKNARRKIKKDLQLLLASTLTWEEKVKGKVGNFDGINILGRASLKNGEILMEFSGSMAEYLVQLPLTQYPIALLGIDERNPNAYLMGLKMNEHFNMDNNQIRGTAQSLRVVKLLSWGNFPSLDSAGVKKNGWEARIKEPFETALDVLTGTYLEDWYYSHSKGVRLTDEEATSFSSFEKWANTLVHFTLKDAPDHTPRLEARAQEKKDLQTKKRKNTGKKKKD